MRRFRRARRPLIALVALGLILVVGYGVRACGGTDNHAVPRGGVATSGGTVG